MNASLRTSLLTAIVATTLPASAATLTWNGGSGGDWSNGGGGWLNGGAALWSNATPDAAVFTGTTPLAVSVNAGGITAGNIAFTATGYSLGGTGTLTLSNSTIDVGSGLSATISAALAGSTGLTKTGAGTLVLSGNTKNYSGGTVINGGAIQISSAAAGSLGSSASGAVTLNGGALHTNFAANTTPSYAITVGASGGEIRNINSTGRYLFGSNVLNGSGTLTLSFGTGAARFQATAAGTTQSGFSGKWVVDGNGGNAANGFLDLFAEQNLGTGSGDDFLTLSNGGKVLFRGFTFSKGITLGTGGGQIANSGGGNTIVSGKISGASGNNLTLDLGGTALSNVTLSNTGNAWLGTTTLATQGNLRLGASGVLPDAGGNVIFSNASAVLDLNGFTETIGGLSGNGIVDNTASGTSSTLAVGGNNGSTTFSGILRNTGASATLALTKVGTGTLTLSGGSNSYAGGTIVQAGVLQIDHAAALGGGNVTLSGTNGTGAGNRAQLWLNGVTVTGKTLTLDSSVNRAQLLATGVSGGTWSGTITLTGSTSANGNTEFSNNVGNGPLTILGVVNGSLTSGGLTLRGDNAGNELGATVNIGSTAVLKTDAGTWEISSTGNTWGTTTISQGTLLLSTNSALPTASNLSMAAGTELNLGGTSSQTGRTGTLLLTGNAVIDFGSIGSSQELAFGNSSALNWGAATLTIDNWETGDLLRFGTDATGLTSAQLANITFVGYGTGAQIDALGYVTAVPEPSAWLLLTAGLSATLLLRRRRVA